MVYLLYFLIAFFLSALLTPLVKRLASRLNILDLPNQPRKKHLKPVPFLGGAAIYLSFLISILVYLKFGEVDLNVIPLKFFLAIIFGGLVLILGGVLDDKFNLPPKVLWLFPALASVIVVGSGIGVGITQISNPLGGTIDISHVFELGFLTVHLSAILVWLWMMGMIFTTKFLDGLDGLCSGVALIGGLTMFALSIGPRLNQPITATIAIIFSGALLGYILYAFHPASIFLGEGGSTFLGFMLGVLSVILGGKIATALLVMGIPILDVAWVIMRRLWYKRSPFRGDREHLHFKLLDLGMSHRQAVLVLYAISAIFGLIAVFFQSMGKLIALLVLFVLMIVLALTTVILYKKKHPHLKDLFDYGEGKGVDENLKI